MSSHHSSLIAAVRRASRRALFGLTLLTAGWNATAYAEPFAYIGSNGAVRVLDTATNTVVKTISLEANPSGVAVAPDGDFVYVALPSRNSVSVINALTNTVTASIPVGASPHSVAVTPDGASVYVANSVSETVSVIDTATNTVAATIPKAEVGHPFDVAVTPDGDYVYVTSPEGFSVKVIATATNSVVATIPENPDEGQHVTHIAVTPDGTLAYATLDWSNGMWVIDTSTNTLIPYRSGDYVHPLEVSPSGIAVTPNSAFVYVANTVDKTVSVIDTGANEVVKTIPVGGGARGITVTPDGAFVYTTDNNTVSVIATATNTVVNTIPMGNGAGLLSFGQFIGPVVCGNGQIGGGQQCDDGNPSNGDGCSSTCTIEPGYTCNGEPSVCQPANGTPVARCHDVTVSTVSTECAAPASIDNGSSDPDGDALTFTQTPAGPYTLGARAVTLTVSDGTLSSQCTGTVTVRDGQAPTLTCPANQTVPASSNSGAAVSFSPTASDNCGTVITSCTPSSGSTFPLGATPVTCTTTDGAGMQTSCGFTVTVTANVLTQLDGLIAAVQSLPVQSTVKLMLTAPLRAAKTALQNNRPQIACGSMQVFEGVVTRLRRANVLTAAQAAEFTSSSQRIRTTLGCP